MRAAEADLPPIPLWGSPALLFTCSPALLLCAASSQPRFHRGRQRESH